MVPMKNCTAIKSGVKCFELYGNGECDMECNNEHCLFDGFDCGSPRDPCNPFYDNWCAGKYADGICDRYCDNAACGWDGLDCSTNVQHDYASGSLIIILEMDRALFNEEVGFIFFNC